MCAEVVGHLVRGRSAAVPIRIADLTVGAGGHAAALLDAAPRGSELLGIDRDARARALAAAQLAPYAGRAHLRRAPFSALPHVLADLGWPSVDAVLLDLGVSSMQLDEADRGFSFRLEADLDMRMDRDSGATAAELLEGMSEEDLARLLSDLGELPHPRRVARALVRGGAPRTTTDLRERITAAVGRPRRHDPATLVFQALRIAVNDELGELERLLEALPAHLAPGARIAVLAYHSLEDRIVKRRFAAWTARCTCPPEVLVCTCGGPRAERLTRRPERPSDAEVLRNPRARSARLRAIEWRGQR
jgi:16S rRNA (cytosine1402-N4)-methyltransferase